jgi:PAS domain S-box-containing protein
MIPLPAIDEWFRLFVEFAPDAAVVVDPRGDIVLVNAQTENMFGYPRNELLGRPLETLVPERFRAVHARHRQRFFNHAQVRAMGGGLDLHGRRRDGSEFPVEISLSPVAAPEGALVACAVRDVTRQKQTEAALLAARDLAESEREALEIFSYSVAHDLRAPLRSMDGFSTVLLREYGARLDETAQDYLSRISAASRRMARLIDGLLELARLNHGVIHPVEVDLSAIAASVAAQFRLDAAGHDPEIVIQPGLRDRADEALVTDVLQNLIGNAWKFTTRCPGARIEFGRDERGYYVRDNGAGFDPAHAGKLFAAFQRLHGRDEFEGTGIGLATSDRIIRRHGGRMSADGRPGQGATFWFTLGGEQ